MIPAWQFQNSPSNPLLNSYVQMPSGWTQAYTVQPYGASIYSVTPAGPVSTPIVIPQATPLGYPMLDEYPSGRIAEHLSGLGRRGGKVQAVVDPIIPLPGPLGDFTTGWAWEHRKGIALGVVGVIGASILFGIAALLK